MRVISGTARGTHLSSIDDIATRPTLDRIKESLFNILAPDLPNAIVLDLFAGSGAIGIECISRGSKSVTFCDKAPKAVEMIQQNLEKTRFSNQATVLNMDYKKALIQCAKEKKVFDIIFLDPPYHLHLAADAVDNIIAQKLATEDTVIVVETDEEQVELEKLSKLNVTIYDKRKYGRVSLIFLNLKGV